MDIMMFNHQTLLIYGLANHSRQRNGMVDFLDGGRIIMSQIVHMCALYRALQKNPDLPIHITYLIEGEEEIGSPSFRPFLEDRKEQLKGDMLLVSDTGSPGPDQLVITTGLRGLTALEVKFFGPAKDLHSGVHGGALMNPLQALAKICSSLHTETGRVTVPGFYDDVIPPQDWEKKSLEGCLFQRPNMPTF